jgi:Autotransporter beta-domain
LERARISSGLWKRALLAAVALTAALSAASGAWAQCSNNFNIDAQIGGVRVPAQQLFPLGSGSAIAGLTATLNSINTAFLTSTSAFVSAPPNAPPNSLGSGVWGRAVVGESEVKTSTVGTWIENPATAVGVTGQLNCTSRVRQDYHGVQAGYDWSWLNMNGTGANWHFGITGGKFGSSTNDLTPAYQELSNTAPFIVFNTPASQFGTSQNVPFVGLYSAYTYRNFFIDGMARWDFYDDRLSDGNQVVGSIKFAGRGFSLTANLGYNIALHDGWFVEPSGGMVWSRVGFDAFNVNSANGADGTIKVGDIDGALGRASLRIGKSLNLNGTTVQPYFVYSLFHEFSGDTNVTSTIVDPTCTNCNGDKLLTTAKGGIGTYNQFALGSAVVFSPNALGYVRADYKNGDQIEGWAVTAGLRLQFDPDRRSAPLK